MATKSTNINSKGLNRVKKTLKESLRAPSTVLIPHETSFNSSVEDPESPGYSSPENPIDEVDFIVSNYKKKLGSRRNSKPAFTKKKSYINAVDRAKGEGGGENIAKVKVKPCKQGIEQDMIQGRRASAVLKGDESDDLECPSDGEMDTVTLEPRK